MSDNDSTNDSSQNNENNNLLPQFETEDEEGVPKTVQSNLAQRIYEASSAEIVKYQASLTEADLQRVRELAPMSQYTVKEFKPTGEKFTNPFGEQEEKVEEGERTIFRKKISQQQFRKIQEMRTKVRLNLQKPPKKQDPNINNWATYEYMAYCFFGLKPEEFKQLDWEEMRPILDACEERTARGLPNTQRPSSGPSTLPLAASGNQGVE